MSEPLPPSDVQTSLQRIHVQLTELFRRLAEIQNMLERIAGKPPR